jgi:hypothetical protein
METQRLIAKETTKRYIFGIRKSDFIALDNKIPRMEIKIYPYR